MTGARVRRTLLLGAWVTAACGPKAGDAEGDATSSSAGDDGIVGTWIGYVEHGQAVPSGSDRVELQITAVAPDGHVTGTASFGEPGTLPPATDPEVGYPDDLGGGYPLEEIFEMFAYPLHGAYDDAESRLAVDLHPGELWSDWCALQTPYPVSADAYHCLPDCGYTSNSGACTIRDDCPYLAGPVDCGKAELCGGIPSTVCNCDANACTSDDVAVIPLDLHLDGDDLQGPIDLIGTAYLTRQ